MRLLDLFCGAGGAAYGYYQAGFTEIVGVDIEPQPNYPFIFIQWDMTRGMPLYTFPFDLIHASPPCQGYSTLRHSPGATSRYPDFIEPTRLLLRESGRPYVIENVVGAPLEAPIQLCGSSFDLRHNGYELRRHRLFETSFPLLAPPCAHRDPVLGVYGDLSKNRRASNRGVKAGVEDAHQLMGIDWMNVPEITEAIPPAYTKFIGEQFLTQHAASRQGDTE